MGRVERRGWELNLLQGNLPEMYGKKPEINLSSLRETSMNTLSATKNGEKSRVLTCRGHESDRKYRKRKSHEYKEKRVQPAEHQNSRWYRLKMHPPHRRRQIVLESNLK